MNLKQYVDTVLVSEAGIEKGREFRLKHAALGLVTEGAELLDIVKKAVVYGKPVDTVHLVEELGDVCWYMALAIKAAGLDPEKIKCVQINNADAIYGEDLVAAIELGAEMILATGMMVKINADSNRPRARGQSLVGDIQSAVNVVYTVVEILANSAKSDPAVVRQANVDKLAKRYGGKFTKEAATNRDLAGEAAVVAAAIGAAA